MVDCGRIGKAQSLFIVSEVCGEVPVTFKNRYHLKNVADIPKENHVAFEGDAPKIRPQFGPLAPENTGKRCHSLTFRLYLPNERFSGRSASAFKRDVGSYVGDIA
jgi:hypothetical protein